MRTHAVQRLHALASSLRGLASGFANRPASWNHSTAAAQRQLSVRPATSQVECIIIGAGVVGLACARALAMRGLDVIIVEKEGAFGTGTSSRNSEVIHAGIYYPAGSLQARLCVEGKAMLYEYCQQRNIPHRRTGKLIVATSPEQVPKLQSIQARGMANGVNDLRLISGKEAIALEPELRCQAALLSPSTGIVSSHALMECLLADAQSHGAALVLGSSVVGGSVEGSTEAASSPPSPSPSSSAPSSSCPSSSSASPAASDDVASSSSSSCSSVGGGTAVRSAASDNAGHLQLAIQELATGQVQRVEAKYVINSAGLDATHVASRLHGLPSSCVPTPYLAKGNYFSLAASPASTSSSSSTSALTSTHVRNSRAPFQRLVYPVPEPGGLGIHYTIDLAGNAKFGPDVEWVDKVDYRVDPSRGQKFYASVRQYWPGLPDEALQPSYCGIRPKITGPGQPDADFLIQGPALHGIRGLVNLFGIGSPGLTSSLAIAEHVAKLLGR